MSIQQKKVSIVIPVYNGSNYLKKAIESALFQTYKNIEIIVVNDGSNDNGETERIALSYGDKIRYFHKENGGVSSALNFGIKNMSGEFFSWLSHDDEYTETKIEKQMEKVIDEKTIVVCSEKQIDKDSKPLSKERDYTKEIARGILSWKEEIIKIIQEPLFSGCSLLIPRKAFEDVGLFDESLRYNQDFDMWLKVCFAEYSWLYINNVGVLSRVHNNQVTQTRRDLFFKDSIALGKRLIPQLANISTKKDNYLYAYVKRCSKYGLKENVNCCFKEAKEKKLFSSACKLNIFFLGLYGKVRPIIRKIYYKMFKRVETK